MKLYKVLVDGRNCHGGRPIEWPLPQNGTPGEWVEVQGEIAMCWRGLHLTRQPERWLAHGCTVYEAEAEGIAGERDDKVVCARARLVRQVTLPEWWIRADRFVAGLKSMEWLRAAEPMESGWLVYEMAREARDEYEQWPRSRLLLSKLENDRLMAALWKAAAAGRNYAYYALLDPICAATRHISDRLTFDAKAQCLMCHICHDLMMPDEDRELAARCWEVWQRGYGLCFVDERRRLHVYRKL